MNGPYIYAALLSTSLLELVKEELEQVINKNPAPTSSRIRSGRTGSREEAELNLRVVKDVLYSREQSPCDEHCTHAF